MIPHMRNGVFLAPELKIGSTLWDGADLLLPRQASVWFTIWLLGECNAPGLKMGIYAQRQGRVEPPWFL